MKHCTSQNKHGILFTGKWIHIVPKSAYLRHFCSDLWWFAYKASRLKITTNHHWNIVNMQDLEWSVFAKASCSTNTAWPLWMSHSLDKIVAFYQHTNNHHPKFWWWFAVVCGGLWWFACIVSGFTAYSPILVVICGGLRWCVVVLVFFQWFVVVCGGLRWFAVICGGLSFSHTGSELSSCQAFMESVLDWATNYIHVAWMNVGLLDT